MARKKRRKRPAVPVYTSHRPSAAEVAVAAEIALTKQRTSRRRTASRRFERKQQTREARLRLAKVLPTKTSCCSVALPRSLAVLWTSLPSFRAKAFAAMALCALALVGVVLGVVATVAATQQRVGGRVKHYAASAVASAATATTATAGLSGAATPRHLGSAAGLPPDANALRLAVILFSAPENRARREHVRAAWLNPVQRRSGIEGFDPSAAAGSSDGVDVRGCFVMPSFARDIPALRDEADAHRDMAFVDVSAHYDRVHERSKGGGPGGYRDGSGEEADSNGGSRGALLLEALHWAVRRGRPRSALRWRERLRSSTSGVNARDGYTKCLGGFAWTHLLKTTDSAVLNRFFLADKVQRWPHQSLIVASYPQAALEGGRLPPWWVQQREESLREAEDRWRAPFEQKQTQKRGYGGDAASSSGRGRGRAPQEDAPGTTPDLDLVKQRDLAGLIRRRRLLLRGEGNMKKKAGAAEIAAALKLAKLDDAYWLTLGEDEHPPIELERSATARHLLVPRGGGWFASRDVIEALLVVDAKIGLSTTLSGAALRLGELPLGTATSSRQQTQKQKKKKKKKKKEKKTALSAMRSRSLTEDICFAQWTAGYDLARTHHPYIAVVGSPDNGGAAHRIKRRYRAGSTVVDISANAARVSQRVGGRGDLLSETSGLPLQYNRFPDVCRLDEWLLQLESKQAKGGTRLDVWSINAAMRRCAVPTATGAWIVHAEQEYVFDRTLATSLERLFDAQTVADFGAGFGAYCTHFEDADRVAAALCYDGAEGIEQLSKGVTKHAELTTPNLDLGSQFDWVLSLGVGEYIPVDQTHVFLNNVVRHASTGVVIAWGVPGQTGPGRVNNLPNAAVKRLMRDRGFRHSAQAEKALRQSASFPWFKRSLMVFVRA